MSETAQGDPQRNVPLQSAKKALQMGVFGSLQKAQQPSRRQSDFAIMKIHGGYPTIDELKHHLTKEMGY